MSNLTDDGFGPHECEICGTDCHAVEEMIDVQASLLLAAQQENARLTAALAEAQRERDALKRAYAYTQSRLELIGYDGWAHKYDAIVARAGK